MVNTANDKIYKGVQVLLFSFLFIYLLLRILCVDTLHDEVATYMFYFYQGDFIGENIQWDANNHLLNSFLGHILYRLFGDNFALLRLPNLMAFVLYFFATVRLTRTFTLPYLKITGLIALNTIPFILEYFGNARGYGLSLGFFTWALVHILAHLKNYSLKSLFWAYFFLGLAVSANITFVLSSLMLVGILVVYPRLNKTVSQSISKGKDLLMHLAFIGVLTPFILFGFALKKAGALYYGSLEGIWDVTGKSLSKYVLFYDADWLQFVYLFVFTVILAGIIVILRKMKVSDWLQQPVFIYSLLFFGNIVAAVGMAVFMQVNYPEDRTAMYLVILFLLISIHLIEHFPKTKWVQLGFLFFPISMLMHLSLSTSVFSPDDRLDSDFYARVKKEIKPEHSVMIYHIMNWNWPYHESHEQNKASVALFDDPNTVLTDILITKTTVLTNPAISQLYDTIAEHKPSSYIAFKRKRPMIKIPLHSTQVIEAKGNLEYANIAQFSCKEYRGKDLQISVEGHLKTIAPKNKIQLIVQTVNADGSTGRYLYYSFETCYQSQLIDNDFLHHFVIGKLDPHEKEIKVYLWNRALHLIELSDAKCTVFELKSPENESR